MGPPLATGLYGCGSHGPQMIYDDSPFGTGGFSIGNCGPKNPGPGSLSKEKRGDNVGMNQPLDVCLFHDVIKIINQLEWWDIEWKIEWTVILLVLSREWGNDPQ